jgi:hypothetical protein
MPLHETPDGLPPGFETDKHPGHWQLHHIADPTGGPSDFTPFRAPDYAEETLSPLGEWLERLGEILGPDHAAVIAERGRQMEAGG